jgi:branched-chain amino acid transport system ATP-binding protein
VTALLELAEVDASYGTTAVLRGVSLEVADGGMVALLGANGAGKTTTLRAICNMGIKTRGAIRFAGRRIEDLATEDIVRLGIGHVPEGRGTFTELTVEENLRVGAYTRKNGVREDIARCYEWFPRLGERSRQHAGSLSGGEQQMLAVSRALMLRPRLLLLDEPSLGLAPLLTRELFGILEGIARDEGITVLIVEQNANLVLKFANYAYVLESGRIALDGDAEQIQSEDAVKRSYLGV